MHSSDQPATPPVPSPPALHIQAVDRLTTSLRAGNPDPFGSMVEMFAKERIDLGAILDAQKTQPVRAGKILVGMRKMALLRGRG